MQNRYMPYAWAAAIASAALLAFGGYLAWKNGSFNAWPASSGEAAATSTPEAASTTSQTATTSAGASVTATAQGSDAPYSMNVIPLEDRPAAPAYAAPLKYDASVSAAVRTTMEENFAATKALIKADPLDFNAWLGIGNLRLIAGDADGAKEIWDYVSKVWPTNEVSFNNLGDYYTNYHKDYAKAEANYRQAIKNRPGNATAYGNLYYLYQTVGYKRGAAAEAVLKEGVAAVPSDINLKVQLARYYRDARRAVEAKAAYDAAISAASSEGYADLSAQLKTEKAAL